MPVWITVPKLAKEGGISPDRLYELSKRETDPFPLRYLPGDRYGRVLVREAEEWFVRNAKLANEL